jgi:hypothetical protein
MVTISASVPCLAPPNWAFLERQLLREFDRALDLFLDKYTRPDGQLIWSSTWQISSTVAEMDNPRDGVDDFYESFSNWPVLYLLGGADRLLSLADREWNAITRQLTDLGPVDKEYDRGYDAFHQGEGNAFFYFLCHADPRRPEYVERARRFAGFYLNEDPSAPNYDAAHRIIKAPHTGSHGPRWGFFEGEPIYPWLPSMERYGLPYLDIPSIAAYSDLRDSGLARRMGEAMQERMGRGDVAINLVLTSLVTNAYLLTGEQKYAQWVVDYVEAWAERAQANDGVLPDSVGLNGRVGEYLDGKWYGGLYGWSWPHGFYNIGYAAIVAAANAMLVSGNPSYLDLPRAQIDLVWRQGRRRPVVPDTMSLRSHWLGELGSEAFLVPYRYNDAGWLDYQPMSPIYPAAVWNLSMDPADWERIERIRRADNYDWRKVIFYRGKEDAGHEQPWLRFIAGDNPMYPEEILRQSYGHLSRRLELMRQDDQDLGQGVDIHHWQELNPISTEALVQLTLGAPQVIYNGGLLHCRVRYFDLQRRRPGLPLDVAALVERLEAARTVIRLVNLSTIDAREVLLQAGAYGEHHILSAAYSMRTSDYPGPAHYWQAGSDEPVQMKADWQTVAVNDHQLHVHMPPATEIVLHLEMARFLNPASYAVPAWAAAKANS